MFAAGKATSGAGPATYIEDVFSTYLYTGTSATQTITNGIDLSTKGGMVWTAARAVADNKRIWDTVRGANKDISTNSTAAQSTRTNAVTAFNADGFSMGADSAGVVNATGSGTYVSWTFRKQPKFFDVVTYTGTGTTKTVAHNLGSVPGCIIVKRTDGAINWAVYHRSLGATKYIYLNSTAAEGTSSTVWNDTSPTSTQFTVNTSSAVNSSDGTYVAYIFAHDAGGFGLAGTDNVISCGSFTGSGQTVTLGYEPQFVLLKRTDAVDDWQMYDTMRGMNVNGNQILKPNLSDAESGPGSKITISSTGFTTGAVGTYIYIAIRRGPMKVPTSGTTVFKPVASSAAGGTALTTNFPVDLQMYGVRAGDAANITTSDRLRGVSTTTTAGGNFIVTSSTAAETGGSYTRQWGNTGFVMPAGIGSQDGIFWNFQRAPCFFDEVCYTGTGSNTTVTHNLGAIPELMFVKRRDAIEVWPIYSQTLGNAKYLYLNTTTSALTSTSRWNNTSPTSSVFTVGTSSEVNASAGTYVAYLFATCPGVSKVGSYTGTGTTKQVDCGFAAGARFVLIKRTDSTGDWYVWDSARGIVSGNDPYLLLNSTAAEVTTTDYIDPYSAGFEISSTAPAAINASGGTFIFLAIA